MSDEQLRDEESTPQEEDKQPQVPEQPSLADVLGDDDFDDRDETAFLAGDEDEGEPEPAKKPEPAPEPVEAAAPEPAPAPEPTSAPEPAPVPVQKAEVPQQPKPQEPAQPPVDLREFEQRAIAELSKEFALTDEQIERVNSEPEKVLPQLAAQVMVRSVRAAVDAIRAHMPQVIAQHTEQQSVQQRAEQQFYEAWPQLKGREDAAKLAAQHARVFRQMAPQATTDEIIKQVGASVMVSLGLHSQPTQQSPAVTGNGEPQVVRREPLAPHRPAAASPQRDLAPSAGSDNMFTQLSFEDDF